MLIPSHQPSTSHHFFLFLRCLCLLFSLWWCDGSSSAFTAAPPGPQKTLTFTTLSGFLEMKRIRQTIWPDASVWKTLLWDCRDTSLHDFTNQKSFASIFFLSPQTRRYSSSPLGWLLGALGLSLRAWIHLNNETIRQDRVVPMKQYSQLLGDFPSH